MSRLSWILGTASIALLSEISMAAPAIAQTPNQSDTSGINVFNNTAPRFAPSPGLNADVISTASRISQELTAAQNAYNAAEQAAGQSVRRFARRQTPECVNPALGRLNQAVSEARAFVEQLDDDQLARLRATPGLKIW